MTHYCLEHWINERHFLCIVGYKFLTSFTSREDWRPLHFLATRHLISGQSSLVFKAFFLLISSNEKSSVIATVGLILCPKYRTSGKS